MSKLDAQRAMREANYARRLAQAAGGRAAAAAPAPAPAEAPDAPDAPAGSAGSAGSGGSASATKRPKPARASQAAASAAPDGAVCGHRSMNGRACTREAGHAEKSHRYS